MCEVGVCDVDMCDVGVCDVDVCDVDVCGVDDVRGIGEMKICVSIYRCCCMWHDCDDTTSHYIILHHTTSHYITLHHTTSHYITFHHTHQIMHISNHPSNHNTQRKCEALQSGWVYLCGLWR